MELARLLLTGGLILIGARIALTDKNWENNPVSNVKDRLPNYIKPKHYEILLDMEKIVERNLMIFGSCHINISIDIPTRSISLHVNKQYIIMSESVLNQIHPSASYQLNNYTYNVENHILVFHLKNEIPAGYYILKMKFFCLANNDGQGMFETSYVNEKGDREWLIVSNFYPIGARRVFPCWDEPAIRATFNISIKHHSKNSLLFDMPVGRRYLLPDDMMLTRFCTTPPIPTYLMAIAIFDFAIRLGSIWNRCSTLPMNFANSIFNKVTTLGEPKLGFMYLDGVEKVAIPGFQYDGIGHWKLIFYRETAITYDDKIDLVGRKINVACLIAREAARQWIGKMVSPSWWSYAWLNEGIAMVLGLDVISKISSDYEMLSIAQIKHESLRLDTQSIMKPLISQINSPSEINSLFSFSYYIKAPAILHMLKNLLTREVFLNGLYKYLRKHMFGSATVDDFWTVMQDDLDKSQSKFDLKKIFYAWTYRAHYPILNVIQNTKDKIEIRQRNVNETDWWIPVTYAMQNYSDFNKISLEDAKWLSANLDHVEFINLTTENDWIIANLQQIGYYRVNYDIKNWLKIAKGLSEHYTKIHVLNRAQIIDDAYHFLVTDKLNLHTFMELVTYLEKETNYIAWYPMIKAIEDMSRFFPFQETTFIKIKLCAIFDGLFKKIKYDESSNKDDITNSLRQEAAKWACILGSSECKEEATSKFLSHILGYHEPLLHWKQWTYCNVISTWDKRIFRSVSSYDNFRKYLAPFENSTMFCNSLIMLKNYNKTERDVDRIKIFHSIIARHAKNNIIFDYLLSNFEEIKPKEISTVVTLNNIINHVYSEEQIDMISAYVKNTLKGKEIIVVRNEFLDQKIRLDKENKCLKSIQKRHDKIVSFIERKIEIRLSEIKSQINYFKKLAKIT